MANGVVNAVSWCNFRVGHILKLIKIWLIIYIYVNSMLNSMILNLGWQFPQIRSKMNIMHLLVVCWVSMTKTKICFTTALVWSKLAIPWNTPSSPGNWINIVISHLEQSRGAKCNMDALYYQSVVILVMDYRPLVIHDLCMWLALYCTMDM